MPRETLDRWLLINYAGYPYAPNALLPDNGLANLAAVLIGAGKSVKILDYATVSTLSRLTSPALLPRLQSAWEKATRPDGSWFSRFRKAGVLLNLHRCEIQRARIQARVLAEIADETVQHIRNNGIQAIGFKLWNGDGLTGSAMIARAIRKSCPSVKIFGGGPHVDFFMEMILDSCESLDAAVYGEGEETILRLAQAGLDSASYEEIPNLLYRRNGKIHKTPPKPVGDLDELPLPAYEKDVYPAMDGDEKIKIMVIDESRGCKNNCAFCIHPIKSDRQQRRKSLARLMAEIDHLDRQFGVRTFRFAGSCTPYELLNSFASEVLQQKRSVEFSSFAHVRGYEDADYNTMREAGCVSLFFGVESGSQRVLNAMHKGVKVATLTPALEAAEQAGIFTVASLIYPAPFDDEDTLAETLSLMRQVRPGGVTVQPPLVVPRTDWFDNSKRYGIEIADREAYLKAALAWKAKLLLPTAFWQSLPVSVDGRSFRGILRKTNDFVRLLAAEGLTTAVSDDMYLMSVKADIDVVKFRDQMRQAFFTGDAAAVGRVVRLINGNA